MRFICASPKRSDRLARKILRSFVQNSNTLILHRIHVHRNAMHSLRRRREHVKALFLFHECQEIILPFDLELQLIYLTSPKRKLTPGAPPLSRSLRQGGSFEFLYKSQNPRPVSQNRRDKDGAPYPLPLFFIHIHVLGIDHAFVFLGFTVAAGGLAGTAARPSASTRRRSLRLRR